MTFGLENDMSNLANLLDPFIQSRKCMNLKFTGVMIIKNDTKFEKELTCQSKIHMRSLTNFDQSTQKSKKFAL